MDFLNSLSQVAKNRKNFKTWEEEQNDTTARREELYNRRKYSPAEIEAAKQLGTTIIDVVDIMDNHSENVAENVETATQPIVGLAPLVPMFGGAYYWLNKIVKPADDAIWKLEDKYFHTDDALKLSERITEDIRKTRPNKEKFYSYKFRYKKYIDKIPNPELKKQALNIHKEFMNEAKAHFRKIKGGGLAVAALTIASFVGANIYASSIQVDSSKIARYQARKILEDPKAFVNYTPEQIAAAKKYIEEHPELKKQKKKEKLKSGMVKSIINVIKDRKAYKESKFSESDTSKKVERPLSTEELKQAKRDKELIQRSVRIINNEAEKYSENMEVAAGIILGTTPVLGGAVGWLAGLLMNKTGLTKSFVDKIVKKEGSEEAKAAYARFRELKEGAPGYSARWQKFVSKLMDDEASYKDAMKSGMENASEELIRKPKSGSIVPKLKKMLAAGLSHRWINAKMLGLAGAVLSAIPAALIALKLQKSAARAGRYTAKRELEKDPRNFIGYTEEDFEEVKDVKGKKRTFGQKVKETAMFVPTVIKQYYAYDKYKRTEFKDHQLLMDQLQKSEDISAEQLRDAKNLQRKLFNTFEKVDDNSQLYSESMEAATEIAQPFALYAGLLTMFSPLIYTAVMFSKGKMSAASILEKLVDKLGKASNFLKGKTFQKYLDDVSENVSHKVGNLDLANKPIAGLISGMDFNNDTIAELGSKFVKNVRKHTFDFRNLDQEGQVKIIKDIEDAITELKQRIDIEKPEIDSLLEGIKYLKSPEITTCQRADMLDFITMNTDVISRMSNKRIQDVHKLFSTLEWKLRGGEDAMRQALDEMWEHPQFYEDFLNVYNLPRGLFDPKQFIKAYAGNVSRAELVANFRALNSKIGMGFSRLDFKVKEIPQKFDRMMEGFERIFKKAKNDTSRMIEGNVAENVKPKSYSEKIANMFTPKEQLAKFKEKVEKMSDVEFQDWMDRIHFSSMDKTTMLKIIPNLEKIINNIPQERIQKVMNSLWTEFQKHPDEVMKLVSSGKITQIFMTKSLVNTAAALGISWTALNIVLIWIIESWLADMQLKAGRLGVMKAMESLDDPAYYANIEQVAASKPALGEVKNAQLNKETFAKTEVPVKTEAPSNSDNAVNPESSLKPEVPVKGNLLDKFKK